ncbi:hypothetical protein LA66_00870 [Aureimonas altamirensis]|uniref:Uncharacterized protein n=1 Tax=Aureimonas altamirensis TaxID=370622 RepID=A0A0B1Q338_9HYPH|nr:hypothetical protein [Aureimonas altamirensis]KHJ55268.1 hypothetical protein LA66_00870 [Aureimonas altamirensis]
MPARLAVASLAACILAPTFTAAAPFGLHAGDRPPSFTILRDNGDGTLVVGNVPAAYPGLVQFFARYDEANGLCSIAGVTAPFDGDVEGIAARLYFDALATRLSGLYGAAKLYSFAIPAGTGDAGWSAEIASGGRYHYAFWHGAPEEDARSIALSVGAREDGRPFVLLTYDFVNFDRCVETRALGEAPAL